MSNDMHEDNDLDPRDDDVAELLVQSRPVPSAAFRSRLKSSLLSTAASPWSTRGRVRLLVATYSTCGAALLLVAAIGLSGAGPLAAG